MKTLKLIGEEAEVLSLALDEWLDVHEDDDEESAEMMFNIVKGIKERLDAEPHKGRYRIPA